MAYGDYIHCMECDAKLIYDGWRDQRSNLEDTYGPEAGLVCPECLEKYYVRVGAATDNEPAERESVL